MTGWTWDQIRDQLDLPRVYALRAAWKDNPPLAVTMRAAAEGLGVQFKGGPLVSQSGAPGPATIADPTSIMAEIGQSEPVQYVPPRRGLVIPDDPAEQPHQS
jgi:hypothetical protein